MVDSLLPALDGAHGDAADAVRVGAEATSWSDLASASGRRRRSVDRTRDGRRRGHPDARHCRRHRRRSAVGCGRRAGRRRRRADGARAHPARFRARRRCSVHRTGPTSRCRGSSSIGGSGARGSGSDSVTGLPGRRAGARDVHVGDDRAAEGRRAQPWRDRRRPRRARRGMGVDRRRHARPRPPAVPRARPDPRRARRAARRIASRSTPAGRRPARTRRHGGTLYFGVPTVWSRICAEPSAARELSGARLLVSGSAPLPVPVFEQMAELTGQSPVERYGMTETLITLSTRASGERRAGYVGTPIEGVETRLVGDDGDADPARRRVDRRAPSARLDALLQLSRPARGDRRSRSTMAGSSPATRSRSGPTGSTASSGASRSTSSSRAATRSAPAKSRRRCSPILVCRRRP